MKAISTKPQIMGKKGSDKSNKSAKSRKSDHSQPGAGATQLTHASDHETTAM